MLELVLAAQLSTADIQRELVYGSTLIVDWAQTRTIAKDPEFEELNPILGKKPSLGRVNSYFALLGLAHFGVTMFLEPENRKIWQNATIAVGFLNAYRNNLYGVTMDFPF